MVVAADLESTGCLSTRATRLAYQGVFGAIEVGSRGPFDLPDSEAG